MLWRTAAHKTKRYVCNLAQCLLAGPHSSILATAGGKGAGRKRGAALHQGHFIITLHQPTTASLTPIASSARHYKCQQCPPHTLPSMPIYWESTPWDLIHVSVLLCPLFCYPGERKAALCCIMGIRHGSSLILLWHCDSVDGDSHNRRWDSFTQSKLSVRCSPNISNNITHFHQKQHLCFSLHILDKQHHLLELL